MWALIAIGVACLLVLLCCCYCICKRCICKKRKSKDGKKGLKASLKPGLEFALKKENVSPCSNVRAQLECLDFTTVCWQTIFFCLKVLSESMSACTYSNIVFGSTSFEWGLVAFVFSLIIQHILIFFPVVASSKALQLYYAVWQCWLPLSEFPGYLDILLYASSIFHSNCLIYMGRCWWFLVTFTLA